MKKSLPILNSYNGKIILFLTIFVLTSLFLHAQERGILLENNTKHSTCLLKENNRIKIQTMLGLKTVGKFTILDDKTIMIHGVNIPLESIFSIKSCSGFSSATKPLLIVVGGLTFTISLLVAALASGFGNDPSPAFVGTLIGAGMISIPFLDNKHYREKWDYKIVSGPQTN